MRRAKVAEGKQRVADDPEARQHARFGRDVKTTPTRVPRQHVGIVADAKALRHAHGAQIDDGDRRIAFAGHERQPAELVEREAVRSLHARHFVACDDPLRERIDRDELSAGLHRDEDALRHGVVVRVPCLAVEVDRRPLLQRGGVDDHVALAALVRHEHLVRIRRVGNPVRISDLSDSRDDGEGAVVDYRDFAGARRGSVHVMMLGDGPDTRHTRKPAHLTQHAAGVEIEDDEPTRVHVADVQATSRWVDALIVEAVRRTWEWDVGDGSKPGRRDRPVRNRWRFPLGRGQAARGRRACARRATTRTLSALCLSHGEIHCALMTLAARVEARSSERRRHEHAGTSSREHPGVVHRGSACAAWMAMPATPAARMSNGSGTFRFDHTNSAIAKANTSQVGTSISARRPSTMAAPAIAPVAPAVIPSTTARSCRLWEKRWYQRARRTTNRYVGRKTPIAAAMAPSGPAVR